MHRKYMALALAALMISGCAGVSEKVDRNVDQTDSKAESLVKDVGHAAPAGVVGNVMPTVVHENGVWLGKNVVKLGQPSLPAIFYEPATFDRTVASLQELAERLTLRSGIPTKVSSDALIIANGPALPTAGPGNGGGANASMAAAGSRSRAPIRITYAEGNFRGLLDTVAARYGVYWKFSNGIIQFYYTDSRTFQITALPGDSTFSATVNSQASSSGGVQSGGSGGGAPGGASGGSGGGASGVSSNNGQNTAINSQLSVYTSIEKTLIAMLSSHGKVVASPSTGSITVVDTPDTLDRIAEFIEAENKALSRQITINVTVLSVTLNQQDNYGIQWDLVYNNLLSNYGITNTVAPATGSSAFSAGILSSANNKFAGSKVLVQALSQQGKVREETSASVVTLNNQPVPVQVATQTSYLASSQTTLTNTVGATTTLTPGVVTTGFNMSILPHVLNNGTVLLQFTTNISALNNLRTVPSGGSSIEVPTIDTRNFLQRVSMKSNETLILSGFEQVDDNITRNGTGTPSNFVFGGGINGTTAKQIIVILITPTTASS
jgi:type IVB pilus formation R64 PilN family outer membrane protein